MWLINAKTITLEQIPDRDLENQDDTTAKQLRYGVLSHRWETDGEPTFDDYRLGRPSCTKNGMRKIEKCCEIAQSQGLELVWADTCCIDKRSSAELQEAINSMYRYYKQAAICFVYLSDVDVQTWRETFAKSKWFTRGWTLQELLAPMHLRFYDRNWQYLGNKSELCQLISEATGIQEDILTGKTELRECSVAQRMSWAANRETTRIEDRAYSLLGIFDVNMPMLYGEGHKSFLRLQEEIIKTLDDYSIFVWRGLQEGFPGLFASSPKAFIGSANVRNTRDRKGKRPYSVNNRGIHGMIPLIPYTLDTYLTILPCVCDDASGQAGNVGIFLRRLYEDDQFMRVSVSGEDWMKNASAWIMQHGINRLCLERSISVRQSPLLPEDMRDLYAERMQAFRINEDLLKRTDRSAAQFSVSGNWDEETRIISLPPGSRRIHSVGSINIGDQERDIEIVRLGFDHDYHPVVYLTQRGILYSENEDHRGVFMENFRCASATENAIRLLPSGENFQAASPALGGHWSHYKQIPDGSWIAEMSPDVDGFWALRADRLEGLDVRIVRRGFRGKQIMYRCVGRVRLGRTVVDGHLLWDLQIDELCTHRKSPSSEQPGNADSQAVKELQKDVRELTRRIDGMSFNS
ncbi:Hypothetical protein R9X50_00164700 [Acrodontium crateriforme]|uniref:Heterokaryon incompatibility domain-containing protein n=1 Tax=Acrodontium crateriforme TaxID=150365 RepID=A0AAQ3M135_9PEZI|nr:Hypothetical protein R9X50_00164700 [Acrodontium crateriforme]